jgi:hypothetical protein
MRRPEVCTNGKKVSSGDYFEMEEVIAVLAAMTDPVDGQPVFQRI